MKMNHINLAVTDVAVTQAFFTKYFDLTTVLELPRNMMAMMTDGNGLVLNISNFDKETEVSYPKNFHVGFCLGSREEVDQQHMRLADSGLTMGTPEKEPGRYGFYIDAPGGFVTEVAFIEVRTR